MSTTTDDHSVTNHPHDEIEALLPWYANGTLTVAETATVERHLAHCPACRADLNRRAFAPEREAEYAVQRAREKAHREHGIPADLHAEQHDAFHLRNAAALCVGFPADQQRE